MRHHVSYFFWTIILIVAVLSVPNPASAGKLYLCIDKNGNELITDELQAGMDCQLKETYRDPSPDELAGQKTTDEESNIEESPESQAIDKEEKKDKTDAEACTRKCKADQEICDDACSHQRRHKPRCRTLCEYYYKQCVGKCNP